MHRTSGSDSTSFIKDTLTPKIDLSNQDNNEKQSDNSFIRPAPRPRNVSVPTTILNPEQRKDYSAQRGKFIEADDNCDVLIFQLHTK